jgi:hypothetical protein
VATMVVSCKESESLNKCSYSGGCCCVCIPPSLVSSPLLRGHRYRSLPRPGYSFAESGGQPENSCTTGGKKYPGLKGYVSGGRWHLHLPRIRVAGSQDHTSISVSLINLPKSARSPPTTKNGSAIRARAHQMRFFIFSFIVVL